MQISLMLCKVLLLAGVTQAVNRQDWCNVKSVYTDGNQYFGPRSNVACPAFDLRASWKNPFPRWQFDTTFTNSDPGRNAKWVVDVTKHEGEERDKLAFALLGLTMGIMEVNPLASVAVFTASMTLDHFKPEKEDTFDVDLTNTINKVMDMMEDGQDRKDLVTNLKTIKTEAALATSDVSDIQNNYSTSNSKTTARTRATLLSDAFAHTFSTQLISRKPQAAWFLFEPMFMLLATRFEVEMLAFTASFQLSHETQDDNLRKDVCIGLRDYRDGGHAQGVNDPASLVYEWNLWLKYFNTAFDTRIASVQEAACSNTNNEPVHKKSFGPNFSVDDNWDWGTPVHYRSSWRGSGEDRRTIRGKRISCMLTFNGDKKESANEGGLDAVKRLRAAYVKQITDKRAQLLSAFTGLYNELRKGVTEYIQVCEHVDALRRAKEIDQARPSVPAAVLERNCMKTHASLNMDYGHLKKDDGFFYVDQLDFQKWGYDCELQNGYYLKNGKTPPSTIMTGASMTASKCMKHCSNPKFCAAWQFSKSASSLGGNDCRTFHPNDLKGATLVQARRGKSNGWVSGVHSNYCDDKANSRDYEVEVFRDGKPVMKGIVDTTTHERLTNSNGRVTGKVQTGGKIYVHFPKKGIWAPQNTFSFVDGDLVCPALPMSDAEKKQIAAQSNNPPLGPMPIQEGYCRYTGTVQPCDPRNRNQMADPGTGGGLELAPETSTPIAVPVAQAPVATYNGPTKCMLVATMCPQMRVKALGRLNASEMSKEENFSGTLSDCVALAQSWRSSKGAGYVEYTPGKSCHTWVVRNCVNGAVSPQVCPGSNGRRRALPKLYRWDVHQPAQAPGRRL